MVSRDLYEVLDLLYKAGASRVPGAEVGWTEQMTPALNYAFTMQYIVHRDTRSGRVFSLTEAGYSALDQPAPDHMSISSTVKSLFRIGGSRSGGRSLK